MIKIGQDRDLVILINAFSCEPQQQQRLIDTWIAPLKKDGTLPGIVSAVLRRCKDRTRVVNYAQWKSTPELENLSRNCRESWFREMTECANPDAHLYEVCYLLHKIGQLGS